MEGGKNGNYKLSIYTFYLHAPKRPSVHEKMTPIVLYRSNISPVQEADQNFQFKKKHCRVASANKNIEKPGM